MSAGTPSVRELRRNWKPHKERLSQEQPGHPTVVRFHRACSWLDQSQKLDAEQMGDVVLIQQWTALNALYGRWDEARGEPVPDRQSLKIFFDDILAKDTSQHVVSVLHAQRQLVLAILENAYLNGHFWDDLTEPTRHRASNMKFKAQSWYYEKRWQLLTDEILKRIYLLRCQLVHGAATFGSQLNRQALGHCTLMMSHLIPAVLRVWIDHGTQADWGPLCYPPQEQTESAVPARGLR